MQAYFGSQSYGCRSVGRNWRRGSGSNRRIKVLQTSPLPLGYRASRACAFTHTRFNQGRVYRRRDSSLERETGVKPATSSLARKHSTTELLPLHMLKYNGLFTHG